MQGFRKYIMGVFVLIGISVGSVAEDWPHWTGSVACRNVCVGGVTSTDTAGTASYTVMNESRLHGGFQGTANSLRRIHERCGGSPIE